MRTELAPPRPPPPPSPPPSIHEGTAEIGPNSVLQTFRALSELEEPEILARVTERARLPAEWPPGLIPEAWFVRQIISLRAELSPERAEAVLRTSGRHTASYVAAHRIPRAFRALLSALPPRLAVPALLRAFARHAWTFAGAGRFSVTGAYPGVLVLEGAPTCRRPLGGHRGGGYYEGAFEGLLGLAAPVVRVEEIACQALGAPQCRYVVQLGENPCASC